jgi:hypothetical protein
MIAAANPESNPEMRGGISARAFGWKEHRAGKFDGRRMQP